MSERVPFIGRTTELQEIQTLITGATPNVMCIVGQGGIGKTRLLEEVYLRYQRINHTLVTNIINFDDRAFHYVENLQRRIVRELGEAPFKPYHEALQDRQKMSLAQVSARRLEELEQQIEREFWACFNKISARKKVVILFDTLEKMRGMAVEEFLIALIKQAHNTLILLAGRDEEATEEQGFCEFREKLAHHFGNAVLVYPLTPLVEQDGRAYLNEKQARLHVTIDPETVEKILALAEGRPILLDLAVEWLSRNIPLDWMDQYSAKELNSKSREALKPLRQEFELNLVRYITRIRTPMDRLLLLMSRIFPFDREMVEHFLELPDEEIDDLLNSTNDSVFIKLLPGNRITLHDEMRRMIDVCVWPSLDPEGERQKRDSRQAIAYFKQQVELTETQLEALAQKTPEQTDDKTTGLELLFKQQVIKQELWALREQLLFHSLFADKNQGVNLFITWYESTPYPDRAFKEVLIRQTNTYLKLTKVKPFLVPFTSDQIYQTEIRRAKFFLDIARYPAAENTLNTLLNLKALSADQQVEIHIQLANVVIRQGRFLDGIAHFTTAVELSRQNHLPEGLVKAENGLGWAYRLIAHRDKAREHYESALALAESLGMKQQQALLYNNLGFLYAYIPAERDLAESYCETALNLYREVGHLRGEGSVYCNLGCINFMAGHFEEALNYFQKALDIFEPVGDQEWLSTVYSWRSAVYLSQNKLEAAEKDILTALSMGIEKDRPMTLSRQTLLYLKRGDLAQAQTILEECYQLSLRLPDVLYQLVSLRDKARLAYSQKDFQQLKTLEELFETYNIKWGPRHDSRAAGMTMLNFGILALGTGQWEKGLNYLKEGLKAQAELGRYGSDTLSVHVERLQDALTNYLTLSAAQIKTLGAELKTYWIDQNLKRAYPNVAQIFETWANWKGSKNDG